MKIKKIPALFLSTLLFSGLALFSCEPKDTSEDSFIPTRFALDVPESISQVPSTSTQRVAEGYEYQVYPNLRSMVKTGEHAGEYVEGIIQEVRSNHLDLALEFAVIGEADGRTKHGLITKEVTRGGKTYEYELMMTDDDGAPALQILWNEKPLEGIAIFSPYDMDRTDVDKQGGLYRVDYKEGTDAFDKSMLVQFSLPVEGTDSTGFDNLKMFFAQNGDVVQLYGNVNIPNFDNNGKVGIQTAYVAKAVNGKAVAEVWYPSPEDADATTSPALSADLTPGYLNNSGVVGAGPDAPSDFGTNITDLSSLSPYAPKDVQAISLGFILE